MRAPLAEFPSRRVYDNAMINAGTVYSIRMNANFEAMMRRVTSDSDGDVGHAMIHTPDSRSEIDENTKFRYNIGNVKLVTHLLKLNYDAKGYNGKDIVVLTPYREQRRM